MLSQDVYPSVYPFRLSVYHTPVQCVETAKYRVRQNKISQHEKCYISEMPEYFLHQISLICLSQYYALMYCFVLYLT